jgi:hypothetical protein
MKYYISKTIKVLPRLKWLNVLVPYTVKEWFTASDKSFEPIVSDTLLVSDKQKHPAESRVTRWIEYTPKP